MDGDVAVAGAEGLFADFEIIGFEIDQSLEEAIKVNVVAKIAYSDTPPAWTTIT